MLEYLFYIASQKVFESHQTSASKSAIEKNQKEMR